MIWYKIEHQGRLLWQGMADSPKDAIDKYLTNERAKTFVVSALQDSLNGGIPHRYDEKARYQLDILTKEENYA